MIIKINDGTNDELELGEEVAILELNPFFVINARELAVNVAYDFFDAEYDIEQEDIDRNIREYLKNVREYILRECIEVLNDNDKVVL